MTGNHPLYCFFSLLVNTPENHIVNSMYLFSHDFPRIRYPKFVSLSGLFNGIGFIDYDEKTNSIDKADGMLPMFSSRDQITDNRTNEMIFRWHDFRVVRFVGNNNISDLSALRPSEPETGSTRNG